MIRLHPIPDVVHHCPFDNAGLEAVGWHIPGMRNLADLRCPACGREFYGDLQAGQALYTPLLLEKKTGEVYDPHDVEWFADWLRRSYADQSDEFPGFEAEEFRPLKTPLLLNCLDTLYGHSLLKLLNAQYYIDHAPEYDLIVLIPRFLRWMVPDGVAAVWTVDLPLSRGTVWNDRLAAEIKTRLERYDQVWLSVAYSHPHPRQYAIERFTRVRPFPVGEWCDRLATPQVTFIWREDRFWGGEGRLGRLRHLAGRIAAWCGFRGISLPRREQTRRLILLATRLRSLFPKLDFAVAGPGRPGGLPGWIEDARTEAIDASVEKGWCERYAASHIVVGMHGSNMLLPSAHAGATLELMPQERWGNMVQDLLLPELDCREALLRYRVIPDTTNVAELVRIIISLFWDSWAREISMDIQSVAHDAGRDKSLSTRRIALLKKVSEAMRK